MIQIQQFTIIFAVSVCIFDNYLYRLTNIKMQHPIEHSMFTKKILLHFSYHQVVFNDSFGFPTPCIWPIIHTKEVEGFEHSVLVAL